MSSSCVPTKSSCVMHDPDPGSHALNDHGSDTDSECGSLCTCTSSSMSSIATSVANCNHPNGRCSRLAGSSVSLSQPQTQQQSATGGGTLPTSTGATNGATGQATNANGNPYFVVFVPPTMLPGRDEDCGNYRGQSAVQTALKAYFITACEFCPWVAGFILIYYAFYWWGIGPGFSAFLFTMGSHALIRFLRARGEWGCGITRLSRVPQTNSSNAEEENENEEEEHEEGEEGNNEERSGDAPPTIMVHENPPSYELAVVKPPPYDLYHHLTPTQPRSQIQQKCKENLRDSFLKVPEFLGQDTQSNASDCDDDLFLPSYQDAIRLSFRSEKEEEDKEPPTTDGDES